VTMIDRIDTIE